MKNKLIGGVIFLLPALSFAGSFRDMSLKLHDTYLSSVLNLLISFAILFFFYSVMMIIISKSSGSDKEKAKDRLLWSVAALFVMFSFWGLIRMMKETVSFDESTPAHYTNFEAHEPTGGAFKWE